MRRKEEYYNSGQGKKLMIMHSKRSDSFMPIYEIKNTKNNLKNALKRRIEDKNRRCLCSNSISNQFSANVISLIKEHLSMFITPSFQLFKFLSLFQHLADPGFIAPVNSGSLKEYNVIYFDDFHGKLNKQLKQYNVIYIGRFSW